MTGKLSLFLHCLIFVGIKIHRQQFSAERVLHSLHAGVHITCRIAWLGKISRSWLVLHWSQCWLDRWDPDFVCLKNNLQLFKKLFDCNAANRPRYCRTSRTCWFILTLAPPAALRQFGVSSSFGRHYEHSAEGQRVQSLTHSLITHMVMVMTNPLILHYSHSFNSYFNTQSAPLSQLRPSVLFSEIFWSILGQALRLWRGLWSSLR